jgi:putative membrane protein
MGQEISMKLKLIPMFVLASGLSLAMAACSGNDNATDADATASADATPAAAASTAAPSHGAQFLVDAIQTNNAEIKFGEAAQSMGSTQAVRDFGKMLVEDHTKANAEATRIAQAMNVVAPIGIKPDDMAAYNMATSMKGADFDKDFAEAMVSGHQKAIEKFEDEAASSDPAEITDFAKQTLPTLRKHLYAAKSLHMSRCDWRLAPAAANRGAKPPTRRNRSGNRGGSGRGCDSPPAARSCGGRSPCATFPGPARDWERCSRSAAPPRSPWA